MIGNRFVYDDGVILDVWTGYPYEFNEINDWKELCELLNELHNTIETLEK